MGTVSLKLRDWGRELLRSVLGLHVYWTPPHGLDDLADIKRLGAPVHTVFDVGANTGQSALRFHRAFPDAVIHSFEPVSETFRALCQGTSLAARVRPHCLALASAPGTGRIFIDARSAKSTMNTAVATSLTEDVPVDTVDHMISELAIPVLDLLKIDVEGLEIEVLRGGDGLLRDQRIRFILAEVSFDAVDRRHTLFDRLHAHLRPFGFHLVGIYNQVPYWDGKPWLHYADALWCLQPVAGR